MVGPWISFLPLLFKEAKGKLSDIEFLAIKEFGGKLVHDEGSGTTAVVIATLTAASGKDLYLGKAFVSAIGTNSGTSIQSGRIALKENGVIIAEWSFTYSDNGGGSTLTTTGITSDSFEFPLSGNKVAATQTFTLEIISIGAAITFEGELVGFQEDTGVTPQIPSI